MLGNAAACSFINKACCWEVQSAPPQDTGPCGHAFWNISTHAATSLLVMPDIVDMVPRMFDAAVIFTQEIKRNGFSLEFL